MVSGRDGFKPIFQPENNAWKDYHSEAFWQFIPLLYILTKLACYLTCLQPVHGEKVYQISFKIIASCNSKNILKRKIISLSI